MTQAYLILAGRIRKELGELERLVSRAERALEIAPKRPEESDYLIDSIALNLHGIYSGLERLFHQIAAIVDDSLPSGKEWHRELLEQMGIGVTGVRPPVISDETLHLLDEFLRFRHVVRNVYTLSLDSDRIIKLAQQLRLVFTLVKKELFSFADFLEQAGSEK
jgi:hypothetical protein